MLTEGLNVYLCIETPVHELITSSLIILIKACAVGIGPQ